MAEDADDEAALKSGYDRWKVGGCRYACALCGDGADSLPRFTRHLAFSHDLSHAAYSALHGNGRTTTVRMECEMCGGGRQVLYDYGKMQAHFRREHPGTTLAEYYIKHVWDEKAADRGTPTEEKEQGLMIVSAYSLPAETPGLECKQEPVEAHVKKEEGQVAVDPSDGNDEKSSVGRTDHSLARLVLEEFESDELPGVTKTEDAATPTTTATQSVATTEEVDDLCKYRCGLCPSSFTSRKSTLEHLSEQHGKEEGHFAMTELTLHSCHLCRDLIDCDRLVIAGHLTDQHGLSLAQYEGAQDKEDEVEEGRRAGGDELLSEFSSESSADDHERAEVNKEDEVERKPKPKNKSRRSRSRHRPAAEPPRLTSASSVEEDFSVTTTRIADLCTFSCPECAYTSPSNRYVRDHMRKTHQQLDSSHRAEVVQKVLHRCVLCACLVNCSKAEIRDHARAAHKLTLAEYSKHARKTSGVCQEDQNNKVPKRRKKRKRSWTALLPRPPSKRKRREPSRYRDSRPGQKEREEEPEDDTLPASDSQKKVTNEREASEFCRGIQNRCVYRCPICRVETTSTWDKMKNHVARSHKDDSCPQRQSCLESRVPHKCVLCGKILDCERFIVAVHVNNTHGMKLDKYLALLLASHGPKGETRSGRSVDGKVGKVIKNKCVYRCKLCGAKTASSWNKMRSHISKAHAGQSTKNRRAHLEKVAYHKCLICRKALDCDRSVIASHLNQTHSMKMKEYSQMMEARSAPNMDGASDVGAEEVVGDTSASQKEESKYLRDEFCPDTSVMMGPHSERPEGLRERASQRQEEGPVVSDREHCQTEDDDRAAKARKSTASVADDLTASPQKVRVVGSNDASVEDLCVYECRLCRHTTQTSAGMEEHACLKHPGSRRIEGCTDWVKYVTTHECAVCGDQLRCDREDVSRHVKTSHQMDFSEYSRILQDKFGNGDTAAKEHQQREAYEKKQQDGLEQRIQDRDERLQQEQHRQEVSRELRRELEFSPKQQNQIDQKTSAATSDEQASTTETAPDIGEAEREKVPEVEPVTQASRQDNVGCGDQEKSNEGSLPLKWPRPQEPQDGPAEDEADRGEGNEEETGSVAPKFNNETAENLCVYKCTECSHVTSTWTKMKGHVTSRHQDNDCLQPLIRRLWVQSVTFHKCAVCEKTLHCDRLVISSHTSVFHKLGIEEYCRVLAAKYGNKLPSGQERLTDARTKAGLLLKMEKARGSNDATVEDLCVYECRHCKHTTPSMHRMKWHVETRHRTREPVMAKYQWLKTVVTHRCCLCQKTLLCDRKSISNHVTQSHRMVLAEYSKVLEAKTKDSYRGDQTVAGGGLQEQRPNLDRDDDSSSASDSDWEALNEMLGQDDTEEPSDDDDDAEEENDEKSKSGRAEETTEAPLPPGQEKHGRVQQVTSEQGSQEEQMKVPAEGGEVTREKESEQEVALQQQDRKREQQRHEESLRNCPQGRSPDELEREEEEQVHKRGEQEGEGRVEEKRRGDGLETSAVDTDLQPGPSGQVRPSSAGDEGDEQRPSRAETRGTRSKITKNKHCSDRNKAKKAKNRVQMKSKRDNKLKNQARVKVEKVAEQVAAANAAVAPKAAEYYKGCRVVSEAENLCRYQCLNCGQEHSDYRSLASHLQETHQRGISSKIRAQCTVVRVLHRCALCSALVDCDRRDIFIHAQSKHGLGFEQYSARL